ncbi:DUF4282 domain-containing protein [Microbacterium invictum]|uniref:DUF4282 domain-containing protein n=1 Tax=Microbacterium invictum TaxID=515415 RepID=A0AA40VLR1_9MICO|nr:MULTISPECIES: DUF4282 domain-containing protein [Microbacterium]MBB4139636.1 hypothetical protein [Microbacterium invictum]
MSDADNQTPPPPNRSAAEAARAAPVDPDDTGVPALGDDLAQTGRGFLSALFDVSFRTFITRRLAGAFYVVGLIIIAIAFIYNFVGGLINGISALTWNPGAGIALILSTVIIVPLVAFLAVVVLRFVIEGVVALIAIAENTERTAENTRGR